MLRQHCWLLCRTPFCFYPSYPIRSSPLDLNLVRPSCIYPRVSISMPYLRYRSFCRALHMPTAHKHHPPDIMLLPVCASIIPASSVALRTYIALPAAVVLASVIRFAQVKCASPTWCDQRDDPMHQQFAWLLPISRTRRLSLKPLNGTTSQLIPPLLRVSAI